MAPNPKMRVFIEAYGCTQNQGEAAELRRQLSAAGHTMASEPTAADVGVLVSCGVIQSTEDRMVRRWRTLTGCTPKVVVTGCLVPLRTAEFTGPGRERTLFVPIREQAELPRILASFPAHDPEESHRTAAVSPAVEDVVIAQGCTSHCSYCFSRLARGRLTSVPLPEVLRRVGAAVERGVTEIRLSSLDTSCWGEDLPGDLRLPDLLREVTSIGGDFQVRIGMMSPQSLQPIASDLWEALDDPHSYRFLHLPVQSGADRVLDGMRRGYHAGDFQSLVAEARRRLPDLMLATDVIVGFPGETDTEFSETLALLDEVQPEIVNVTRFSARPLTPAARERPLPSHVVKRRSRELTQHRLRVARRRMERWIGQTVSVRFLERGQGTSTLGRLPNYLPLVAAGPQPIGTPVPVRVDGARSTYLLGRPLGGNEAGFEEPLPMLREGR
ncbi:MAG: tRNA (N(6)-L-threonylcarbamoyladenosine(37)-C(2))-methylthiotransferase [Thermoplasmata archaeon]